MSRKKNDVPLYEQVMNRIDVRTEYERLGLKIVGEPNSRGWAQCYCMGEEERNPSAGVNISKTSKEYGLYKNFKDGTCCGLFEFAARFGNNAEITNETEAKLHYAKIAGINVSAAEKKIPTMATYLNPNSVLEEHVEKFVAEKEGITYEGMVRAGVRRGKYRPSGQQIFAIPRWGHTLGANPVGYNVFTRTGREIKIPTRGGGDERLEKSIYNPISTSGKSWYGASATRLLNPEGIELVWIVEGQPDMMAALSIIPESLIDKTVVVTAGGTSDDPTELMLNSVKGLDVAVCFDADVPAQGNEDTVGAAVKWCNKLLKYAKSVRNVQLPFKLKVKNGKDLRDWIAEGGNYDSLLEMYRNSPEFEVDRSDPENWDGDDIVRELGIEVLGADRESRIYFYTTTRQIMHNVPLSAIERASYDWFSFHAPDRLEEVKELIRRRGEKDESDKSVESRLAVTSRRSILRQAAMNRFAPEDMLKTGVWLTSANRQIVLNSGPQSAYYNGTEKLEPLELPMADGEVLWYDGTEWLNFDKVQKFVDLAHDVEWRRSALQETRDLIAKWLWNNEHSATMLTGMMLATWMQGVVPWRPYVVVEGQSQSGKSEWSKFLKNFFGKLGWSVRSYSEAGIRQEINERGNLIVMLDEFEWSPENDKILLSLRGASSGEGDIVRGTATQKASVRRSSMMPWILGINSGLDSEADINRSVQLGLIQPEKGKETLGEFPEDGDVAELGEKMLACAIVCCKAAIERWNATYKSEVMKETRTNVRRRQTLALPAAFVGEAMGLDQADTTALVSLWLESFDDSNVDVRSDQKKMLDDILSSTIRSFDKNEQRTVAAYILDPTAVHTETLANHGISVATKGNRPAYVAFSNKCRELLPDKPKQVLKVLARLDGAEQHRNVTIGETRHRAVTIPWDQFMRVADVSDDWFGEEDE